MLSIALVRIPFGAQVFVTTFFLADIFELDPNYLENEENFNWIMAETLGEGSFNDDDGTFESSLRASPPQDFLAIPEKEGIERPCRNEPR